ncbi:hypothetical protein Agub_g2434, partial [Astrephomene gubernaculifera]
AVTTIGTTTAVTTIGTTTAMTTIGTTTAVTTIGTTIAVTTTGTTTTTTTGVAMAAVAGDVICCSCAASNEAYAVRHKWGMPCGLWNGPDSQAVRPSGAEARRL